MELGNTVFWVEPLAGGKGLEFPQSQPAVEDSPPFLLENGSTQRLLPCVGGTLLLGCPLLPGGEGFVLFRKAMNKQQNGAVWVWFTGVRCWSGGS